MPSSADEELGLIRTYSREFPKAYFSKVRLTRWGFLGNSFMDCGPLISGVFVSLLNYLEK